MIHVRRVCLRFDLGLQQTLLLALLGCRAEPHHHLACPSRYEDKRRICCRPRSNLRHTRLTYVKYLITQLIVYTERP